MQPPPGRQFNRAKAKADGWTDDEIDSYLAQFQQTNPQSSKSEDEIVMEGLGFRRDEPYGVLPNVLGGAEQFARGAGLGATQALTSAGRGLGYFVGSRDLEDWFKEREKGAEEFFHPEGTAGKIGQIAGRIAGEVGTAVVGGGGIAKGASLAGRGLRALRGIEAATAAAKAAAPASRLATIARTTAAGTPIDILQGLGQDEGLFAKSRGGAALENVLFSGAGAGVAAAAPSVYRGAKRLLGMADDSKAARAAAILKEKGGPITDPRRLLRSGPTGEPIPMGPIGSSGSEAVPSGPVPFGLSLVPYRQSSAIPVGPEVQAARRDVERTVAKRRSSAQRRTAARQSAIDLEEEIASDPELAMQYLAQRLGRGKERRRLAELSPEDLLTLMRAAQRMRRMD